MTESSGHYYPSDCILGDRGWQNLFEVMKNYFSIWYKLSLNVSRYLFYLYQILYTGSESPKASLGHQAGLDSQLRTSIESFAAYISDHFSPTRGVPRVGIQSCLSQSLSLFNLHFGKLPNEVPCYSILNHRIFSENDPGGNWEFIHVHVAHVHVDIYIHCKLVWILFFNLGQILCRRTFVGCKLERR